MKTKQLLLVAVTLVMTAAVCGLNATTKSGQAHPARVISHSVANSLKSGDVNGDGAIDVADIAAVISVMAGSTDVSFANADVNGDGNVDVTDISAVIDLMVGQGDADEKAYTACPNANHPHWIDLGIGTLWRCCNEGASRPEDYGGYYQFGQVASAPTLDQIKALVNDCSYTWTTQNGVNGGKFTGPNGGTIFLPAAGSVWEGELYDVGFCGDYWSSTLDDDHDACDLLFTSGFHWYGSWYDDGRAQLMVRPVR